MYAPSLPWTSSSKECSNSSKGAAGTIGLVYMWLWLYGTVILCCFQNMIMRCNIWNLHKTKDMPLPFAGFWLQFLPVAIVSFSSASSKDFRSGTGWSVVLTMLAWPTPANSCSSSCCSGLSSALQMLCSSAWEAFSSGTSCEPITGQCVPFSQCLASSLDNSLFYSSLLLAVLMIKPVFKMHSF